MLVGVTLHKRSVESVVSESVIAPLNPFSGATVIVDGLLAPVVTEILVGLTVNMKSCT